MADLSQNRERARPFGQNRRYFLGGTAIGSAKVRLSILLLLLSIGWVAVAASSRERRDRVTNHGPIHRSHAAWIDQCDACHVPFDGNKSGLFETQERWNTFRCETCHAGPENSIKEYAPHQPGKIKWNDLRADDCTLCHKDHQGVEFALSKPSDAACTQCHANLQKYHTGTPGVADIKDFSSQNGHPDFKVLQAKPEDLRSIKFSHAVHMTPGQTTKWKLADLAPPMRAKYEKLADSTGLITLDCAACHELDSTAKTSSEPARQSGEVYLPISHDKHCAACHDLGVGEKATLVNAKLEPFSVTHGTTAPQLKKELQEKFLAQLAKGTPGAVTLENKPGQRLDPLAPSVNVPKSVQEEVTRLSEATYRELFAPAAVNPQGTYSGARYCLKCHVSEPGTEPTLKKPDVHTVWLKAARFNHAKHRAMDCKSCHQQKYQPLAGVLLAKDELEKPDIPGIQTCQQCHAPAGKTAQGQPVGGVRHACVDCHSYHNGAFPTHGPGSPFRDPPVGRRLTTEDMLRGTPKDTPR